MDKNYGHNQIKEILLLTFYNVKYDIYVHVGGN